MYKILIKKTDAGANSTYSFLTTSSMIGGSNVLIEKEFSSASDLDEFVEKALEEGIYRKTDLRIVQTYDNWKVSTNLESI